MNRVSIKSWSRRIRLLAKRKIEWKRGCLIETDKAGNKNIILYLSA